ncbi:hypothetical protein VKT23_001095 [Stygiomarasmius scandens]|uniref:Uncharacterized protein n=1 Tax=Marasmiellus scandens TaxID=2682957 RepID=A0ABR1K620_9AGAR
MFDDENIDPLPIRPRGPSSFMGSGATSRSTSGQQSRRSSSTTLKQEKKDLNSTAALLALERDDNRQLRKLLEELRRDLTGWIRRAEAAESDVVEVTSRLIKINQERIDALHEVARLQQQVEVYKVYLNAAKAEIRKAQTVIDQIDIRAKDAEESAKSYKKAKRKLSQDLLAREWKDEGIKEGFIQGMERARAEVEAFETLREENSEPPVIPSSRNTRDSSVPEEDDSYLYQDDTTSRRHSSTTDFTTYTRPETPVNVAPPPPPPHRPIGHPPAPVVPHNEEPHPIPVPPPTTHHLNSGDIHPTIIHNVPHSPRHPPVHIPPDGFIPILDEQSRIVLPPSHELSPAPPITSPLPPFVPLHDTKIVPPPGEYTVNMTRGYRQPASPESNSTTISQFEMVNDPPAKYSPQMSAIMEVASERNSPIPNTSSGNDLHRNTSLRSTRSGHHSPAPNHIVRTPSRQDEHRSHHSQSPEIQRNLYHKPSAASISSRHGKTPDPYGIYTRPTSSHSSSGGRATPAVNPGHQYTRSNVLEDTSFLTKTPKARAEELPSSTRRPTPLDDTSFITKTPKARPEDLPEEEDEDDHSRHREPPHVVIPRQESSGPSPPVHRSSPGLYTGSYPTAHHRPMYPSPSWHSENSANIGVDVESPTPPKRDEQQFDENPREFREFLGPSDAERPLPMMMSPSQSSHNLYSQPSNTMYSVPTPGTPIATPGGIFIPAGPPASSSPNHGTSGSPRPPSPRPPSPSGPRNMPGGYMSSAGEPDGPPVIPNLEELKAAEGSDTESDVISSAMQSAFTTPLGMLRQLSTPATTVSGRGSTKGTVGRGGAGGRGGKKKKR